MSSRVIIVRSLACLCFLMAATPTVRAADSNTSREYREALEAHEKAVAAAIAPENKRYAALLDTLLHHAEMEGDAATKGRIAGAIKDLAEQSKPTAPQNSVRDQCLGAWQITYSDSPALFHLEILPDGTVFKDGHTSGTWEVKNNRLQIVYGGKYTDVFDLPGRDGQLHGQNGFKVGLTLTREGQTAPLGPVGATRPGGAASPGYFGTK